MASEPHHGLAVSVPRGGWALAVTLAPLACSTLSAQEQPAVIAAHTDGSRAELAEVVASAFGGQAVMLADDALTRDSVLTIERRTAPGPQGRAATGRTLEAPEQFRLVLRGTRCVLVRQADGREWELRAATCVPAGR
jgi:hypothetical protein